MDEPLFGLVAGGTLPIWVVFLASIPIAFINPTWAMYFWILLWPVSAIHGRLRMRGFVRAVMARLEAEDRA
ncbi:MULTISPECIES: hypothetical protein [Arthrobacter]|uniref:hypothetical protein n=1 Tax=Arthrobacter TaxID=1663 RepID=UPI000ABCD570|nr:MULTISPECIES: hypothetical protein [Arthrobacter]